MISKYKDRETCDMILLQSKEAAWDRKLNSYVLNFKGRAKQVKYVFNSNCVPFKDSEQLFRVELIR